MGSQDNDKMKVSQGSGSLENILELQDIAEDVLTTANTKYFTIVGDRIRGSEREAQILQLYNEWISEEDSSNKLHALELLTGVLNWVQQHSLTPKYTDAAVAVLLRPDLNIYNWSSALITTSYFVSSLRSVKTFNAIAVAYIESVQEDTPKGP